jgi:hypothetical protein
MKKLTFVLLILSNYSIYAQKIDRNTLLNDVQTLSSDSFEGRKTGSAGNFKAADYITNRFDKIGLKSYNENYKHPFIVRNRRNEQIKGINLIGYIKGKSEKVIIISAHYDHVGINNSEIFNGADDNASGTASMIELAFALKQGKSKQYNFLFTAFSAEELGLNGSKYFVENPTIDLKSVNYMINMDMVGRMNDSSKTITVGGYGTSSSWNTMISAIDKKDFSIKTDSSGSGPSDHTSFYRKDIPVLFFFTGLHSDYHKPSDDADKINYVVMFKIIRFIELLIRNDKFGSRIDFLKTREQQTSTSTRFSVSMGIMPDYSYSGNGVRVDGVSENRPAKKVIAPVPTINQKIIIDQLGNVESNSGYLGK